jgi:hypothetical protein
MQSKLFLCAGMTEYNSLDLSDNPVVTFIVRRNFYRSPYHSETIARKFSDEPNCKIIRGT